MNINGISTSAVRFNGLTKKPEIAQQDINLTQQEVNTPANGVLPSTVQFLSVNAIKSPSFGSNNFQIALSEEKLDEMLNTKTVKYNFNPEKQYNKLAEGDKKALKHLVKVATILNDVYLEQDNSKNVKAKKFLETKAAAGDTKAQKALTLFNIFNGAVGSDGISKEKISIFEGINEPVDVTPTSNLYPENATPEEVANYLNSHIEQAPAILSNDTIVKRNGKRFYALPYSIAFREKYEAAAKELLNAAKETTHKGLANSLRLQAQALVSNDPEYSYKADQAWANLDNPPLEFTITRESYDDQFTSQVVKDSKLIELMKDNGITPKSKDLIGIRVGIVDLEASKQLSEFKQYLGDMGKLMPMREQYKQSVDVSEPGKEVKQTLSDVDLVLMAGSEGAKRPGITIAQNLPNSDKLSVQLEAGRRNVFHKQIRNTFDRQAAQKMLDKLVEPAIHQYYDPGDASHHFTIGHELTHSLGPLENKHGAKVKAAIGEYGDTIEETKADLGSIVTSEYLVKKGVYTKDQQNNMFVTWAVKQMPIAEPPKDGSAHRIREVMQFNYFVEKGAIEMKPGGKMNVNLDKMVEVANQMLKEVIQIQLDGNMDKAADFVGKYRAWNETLQYISDVKNSPELAPKPLKILETHLADKLLAE